MVAGSTVEGKEGEEEALLMRYWPAVLKEVPEAVIVVAPRHPDRFAAAYSVMKEYGTVRATELLAGTAGAGGVGRKIFCWTRLGIWRRCMSWPMVAFVGGSLVRKGGHNPLEAAQFGVPVVMGPSFENFRDVVERMRAADGILICSRTEEV